MTGVQTCALPIYDGLIEVDSQDLGKMVLQRLVDVDKVAYVRFASVYRDFKDVDEFSEELRSLVP